METHTIHSELLRRRVRVLVVGCGGRAVESQPVFLICTTRCLPQATLEGSR